MKTHLWKTLTILVVSAILVLILDQATKAMIRQWVDYQAEIEVIPGFFSIVHIYNTGIAFGLFQGQSGLITILGLLALGVNLAIFWGEWKKNPVLTLDVYGMGLILGGALGNLVDRLAAGKVTDFLLFSLGSYHWPAFNIADSGITIGILMILFVGFFHSTPEEKQMDSENQDQEESSGEKTS